MKIIDAKKAELKPNPHNVAARMLYDHEPAQAIELTLQAGESLKRHITPVDVFFYVLEGTGVVEVGEEEQEVSANHLVESPAKIVHCWHNRSDAPLRILVVKVPRPTEATRLL